MTGSGPLYPLHAVLALGVEIAVLVAVVRAGITLGGGGVTGWALGLLALAAVIGLWALWGAPKSATRLEGMALLAFKTAIFGLAALAFLYADGGIVAAVFAIIAGVHVALAVAKGWL